MFLKRPCNTLIILNFNYFTEICLFRNGSIEGGLEFSVGAAYGEQECASWVKRKKPDALGATIYGPSCYAEYGKEVNENSNRHCFFGNIL